MVLLEFLVSLIQQTFIKCLSHTLEWLYLKEEKEEKYFLMN